MDKTIKLWDVATGKNAATLNGHTDGVEAVTFSPDGKTLASGSGDKTIKLWDVATGKNTATFNGHIIACLFRGVQPGWQDLGFGKLWTRRSSCGTWPPARTPPPSRGIRNCVQSVAFSPDGKTLASGSDDKTIKLWDVATGKKITTLSGHTNVV